MTFTDIPLVGEIFPDFTSYVVVGFVVGGFILAPAIGYMHGKYQNPTDVKKTYAPLLEEIRRIVDGEEAG